MAAQAGYVYMVRCRDGSLYAGWTNDLTRRLAAHNAGSGAKYTRGRRPVRLAFAVQCADKNQALRCEARLKRATKQQKEQLAAEWKGVFTEERGWDNLPMIDTISIFLE